LGLAQTDQYTDDLDKRYGIWFDVFTDSVDIHDRINNPNHYGPVLLTFDLDIVKGPGTGRIWVTKTNPSKWPSNTRKDRWFDSTTDLKQSFTKGTFDHMVVFRHCGGALPIEPFLRRIILDDPKLAMAENGADLFSVGFGALSFALVESGLQVPLGKRKCSAACKCAKWYSSNSGRARELFVPE
jgi:hypothetical protein